MELIRRDFLKGAVAGGAALAVGAPVAGALADEPASEAFGSSAVIEPITEIAATEDTEILVIGAGIAGVSCALAAVEAGAQVTVLQKSPTVLTTGSGMCAYNVEAVHAENGFPMVDFAEKIIELNNDSCGGTNIPLARKFFDSEVEAVTWFLGESIDVGLPPDMYRHPAMEDPCIMWLEAGIDGIAKKLGEKAEQLGVVFHFSTPAVQLVTNADGAVTGAIGLAQDGTYIQVNASKGVVLAAGDYSNNVELLQKWCPAAAEFIPYPMPERSGDGLVMAQAIGAQIAPYPHTKMVHAYPYLNNQGVNNWLQVDLWGDRVFPEDLVFDWRCNAIRGHAENSSVQIFDSNYEQYLAEMGGPTLSEEEFEAYAEQGWAVKADTLEELAVAAGLYEGNRLVETVARYNELVAAGVDTDFFKNATFLKPIDTPPYYACMYQQFILSIPSGLQVDADCRVIGGDFKPIEGLYAIGNCQGGMFGGTDYPFAVNCGSVGRCSVFGYVVGRALAGA